MEAINGGYIYGVVTVELGCLKEVLKVLNDPMRQQVGCPRHDILPRLPN